MALLPWHIPLENLPPKTGFDKNLAPTLLEHHCNIDIHQEPREEVNTAIMCDIGDKNKETAFIQCLIAAGMTIARINLKELDTVEHEEIIQSIRQAVYNYSMSLDFIYPLAVIAAISGPEIITGELQKGVYATIELVQDQDIKLTNDPSWEDAGTPDCLYINYPGLTVLRRNDVIFIECLGPDRAKLEVQAVGDNSLICHITTGGVIGPKMAVRISQIPYEVEDPRDAESYVSIETLSYSTEDAAGEDSEGVKIDKQITWALSQDVDAFLLPATQTTSLIHHIKTLLEPKSKHILLIASIETIVGLDNIDHILEEADGIYLDRSILSTDLAIEKVFIAQKILLSKCNKLGKVCICSGVLNEQIAMMSIGDLAQLVLDGADVIALELHYDPPIQRISQPQSAYQMAVQCIEATAVVCKQAESIIWARAIYGNIELMKKPHDDPTTSVAVSAVEMALRTQAVVIICLTNSGRSARLIAKARPLCPLVAVTRICHVARQLRFWRGIRTIHYFEEPQPSFHHDVSLRVQAALSYCKLRQIVRRGDPYVLVTGHRRDAGYTNTVRVLYACLQDEPAELV